MGPLPLLDCWCRSLLLEGGCCLIVVVAVVAVVDDGDDGDVLDCMSI